MYENEEAQLKTFTEKAFMKEAATG